MKAALAFGILLTAGVSFAADSKTALLAALDRLPSPPAAAPAVRDTAPDPAGAGAGDPLEDATAWAALLTSLDAPEADAAEPEGGTEAPPAPPVPPTEDPPPAHPAPYW